MDELCLRTTSRSLETLSDRGSYLRPGGSPTAPRTRRGAQLARHEVSAHEGAHNEVLRQQEAMRLNQSAVHREQAAKELRASASCEKLGNGFERARSGPKASFSNHVLGASELFWLASQVRKRRS